MRIGIMQGRLVPPVDERIQAFPRENWDREFALAAKAGLACIEWVYDRYGEDINPLATVDGINRIRELAGASGVDVRSVCADYFMERPLAKGSHRERRESLERLDWLLGQCGQLGVQRVVLPFVDQSAISSPMEEEGVIKALQSVLPTAERLGIELHLETSLGPDSFRALLARASHPLFKVNYDIGNSASLGYRPQEEFAAYGERLGSVHIKDRLLGGTTVPLGTGSADFGAVFGGLRQLRYAGDFILQAARGPQGDELAWTKENRAFVENGWSE
jgi:hexulose-6-phosphate isomerase